MFIVTAKVKLKSGQAEEPIARFKALAGAIDPLMQTPGEFGNRPEVL